jgi:dienelactone hydrolase
VALVANVVLFHSIYGRRPAVLEAADRFRSAGHAVATPDLYGGTVFGDLAEARRFRDRLGEGTLTRRARAAVAELPADLIYSGFSMGGGLAAELLMGRPGAGAALLFSVAVPPEGGEQWPAEVPAQVHYAIGDPFVLPEEVDGMRAAVTAAGGEFTGFGYPDSGHLFADPELPDFNPDAAEQMFGRAAEYLARWGRLCR